MFPALYDVAGVAADDVLNLRAEPSAAAQKRGELAPNAVDAEVLRVSEDGRWGLVAMSESTGWAAMRYLQRQPGPDWDQSPTRLACSGTEPFWSAKLDAAKGQVFLDQMDSETLGLWFDWKAEADGRRGVIGMSLLGPARVGFATLTGQSCTDGMSDREYGIALTLFLKGVDGSSAGTSGFSGCCRLAP